MQVYVLILISRITEYLVAENTSGVLFDFGLLHVPPCQILGRGRKNCLFQENLE
jgi:hypothetical protein